MMVPIIRAGNQAKAPKHGPMETNSLAIFLLENSMAKVFSLGTLVSNMMVISLLTLNKAKEF